MPTEKSGPIPFRRLLLAAFFACVLPIMGLADQPKPDAAATIRKNIEARYPGTHVLDIQPSAMAGVYEIFLGDEIVYSDASGDYILMGPMVDTQTRKDLTEARLNEHGRINFDSLPLARAIKVVKGNGSRRFAVFSDPDCPFCQQLEKSLLSVNNLTMYVFLFPIGSLHPQAPAKAHAIWCAKDRSQAWTEWMHERKLPPAGTCAGDPVAELQKLGETLHVNSTPTLFFGNGRRVAGAISTAELEELLSSPGTAQPAGPAAPKPAQPSK
ncbi:MAG TPA: DsbC family protein [Steroidobacteraceae bacterium]|jgi:thiol:disulfide interchange protein DsbC